MKKILIIEDEPEMRSNFATFLRFEGFDVAEAPNGRQGVAMARRNPPDLIICDVMMPELDGYGVLHALRAEPATAATPFIFLTAKGEKADLRFGMNLGADDYLTKPVAFDDLLAAVVARFQRREQQQTPIEFKPDFSSAQPLCALGLTPRVAEVLLWVAQGKTNSDVAVILGISESTVKKHMIEVLERLGVETRTAASLRALEVLSARSPTARRD